MIGYGEEDSHFVLELTYNYGIDKYEMGNDFKAIHINAAEVFASFDNNDLKSGIKQVTSPDGYPFIINDTPPSKAGPVCEIALASSNIANTVQFWNGILGLNVLRQTEEEVVLYYSDSQAHIRFQYQSEINHGKSYGRIAFSVPFVDLEKTEKYAVTNGYTILTPLITLKTEGKADVSVVIFSDPDGYEICFVDDKGFSELSKFDLLGDRLLEKAMEEDKSEEWFAKKGKSKASAS